MSRPRPSGPSLSLRLLGFAGGLIALALILAWLILGLLFERHLERQIQSELERHGLALIAATTLGPDQKPQLGAQPFDPRFNRPASGLYWRITATGGVLASRSLWDAGLDHAHQAPADGWQTRHLRGPYEARALVVSRDVLLSPQTAPVLFEVAADLAPIQEARRAFALETGLFLVLLWLVLALAAWAQVRLGLKPLERISRDLTALNLAPKARLIDTRHPQEVRPLTLAVNRLLDARATDLERARRRSRDLAHALKTPLTALRLQIEDLPPSRAEKMLQSLSLIGVTVEAELARALSHEQGQATEVAKLAERLWQVIARTPQGQSLDFVNRLEPDLTLPLADDRCLELLGALFENASRFGRTTLEVSAQRDPTGLRLFIDDDGPGIPEDQRDQALRRGLRLDEQRGQHGLGLAIANDIIDSSGGHLDLGTSPAGGLRVQILWPVGRI